MGGTLAQPTFTSSAQIATFIATLMGQFPTEFATIQARMYLYKV